MVVSFSILFSSYAFANWYAGTNKGGSLIGIAAHIKTPSSLPTFVSGDWEYCWITNLDSSGHWVQSGLLSSYRYVSYKTYVEHSTSAGYHLNEYGSHLFNTTTPYNVSYKSDNKWHGYIADVDKEI